MKRLLLFAGLPGVGKSTISRQVNKETGARIVDIDDFKKTNVDPSLVKTQIDPPELRWAYYQKALEYVFGLFEQGVSMVIMDEVFHLSSLRAQLETLCATKQVQVLWVEVQCPYDTVEKRLQSTTREGHILSSAEALKMHLMFKEIFEGFPTDSPNHVVVNNEDGGSVGELVGSILKKS